MSDESLETAYSLMPHDDGDWKRMPALRQFGGLVLGATAILAFAAGGAAAGMASSSVSLSTSSLAKDSEKGLNGGHLASCEEHVVAIKRTVCLMDHKLVSLGQSWRNYTVFAAAMRAFWDETFTYTPMYGIDESIGMAAWYHNEMSAWTDAFPWVEFNQMMFLGSGPNASSATYAVGDFERALGPLAPTGKRTTVRITDFYVADPNDGKIAHNWMMIDLLDLLRQQGRTPLPLSPLPQGRVSPPLGDGIPAPLARYTSKSDADEARRVVSAMLDAEWVGTSTDLDHWHTSDMVWYGPVPFGMAVGGALYAEHFLRPFHSAFAEQRSLRTDAFACEAQYCAMRATFSGKHTGEWLGFEPSGQVLQLDVGMHWRVVGGKIFEAWALFDLPRMILPLGTDLLTMAPPARQPASAEGGATAAVRTADDVSIVSAAAIDITPINNDCSNKYTKPPGGADVGVGEDAFDCPAFVIRSTDETWHPRSWEATNRAVDKYFAWDWQSVRAFGMMLRGREALRAFMRDWLGGFPDVIIHVADVFCLGNQAQGYKTTMPYVLTATHSGWSQAFGTPTGKRVKYHGIANCYIQREPVSGQWQYTREWDLPDMWAFITALNLTADQIPAHPGGDLVPVDECKPLFEWGTGEMNWFPSAP